MNGQNKELLVLQNIVNYYRNKCSELEYQFILYKAEIEPKMEELHKRLDRIGSAVESKEASSDKERISNEKNRKKQ